MTDEELAELAWHSVDAWENYDDLKTLANNELMNKEGISWQEANDERKNLASKWLKDNIEN